MSSLKDIPSEVWWAWGIKMQGMCGTTVYEKCREIVAKYPEHFPDEVKYKKVPQSVHDAYTNEMYPSSQLMAETKPFPENKGGGIFEEIDNFYAVQTGANVPAVKGEFTYKDFEDAMAMMIKASKDQWEQEQKEERIWNKHYAKYGLHYVKGKHIIT